MFWRSVAEERPRAQGNAISVRGKGAIHNPFRYSKSELYNRQYGLTHIAFYADADAIKWA
jgi:hypothetical protein